VNIKQALYRFIYFRILKWKAEVPVPLSEKCIVCAAPHTTNYDLIIGKLFYGTMGRKCSFMIKKEWFFFPMGYIFRAIGGIPVERNKKTSLTQQMVKRFNATNYFNLAITPEGTRKATSRWKKGFYYIALKANVPIVLIGIDYSLKVIKAGKIIIPTGDYDKDLIEIKNYFKTFKGKHPENFIS